VKIEHVNGILKGVFSSLKELRIRVDSIEAHQHAVDWISACLIIYNILSPNGSFVLDAVQPYEPTQENIQDENVLDDFTAEDKRMSLFYFIQDNVK
jgi:hypothetical protein